MSDWARARSGKERRRKSDFMVVGFGRGDGLRIDGKDIIVNGLYVSLYDHGSTSILVWKKPGEDLPTLSVV